MSGTKTDQAKLGRLLTDAEGGRKPRARTWVAGAVAAAAAVVAVIVWAMGLSSGKPDSISPLPAQPLQPEQVATAYVNAYANYDRPRLKSFWRATRWPTGRLWTRATGVTRRSSSGCFSTPAPS